MAEALEHRWPLSPSAKLAAISNPGPKPRGRFPGVRVDPEVIRRARQDAGLSMAKLAGTDLTRQAIFLIETGKTKPSLRTLELIAARTGKPLSYFTDGDLSGGSTGRLGINPQVDELQALCLQQQFDKAIDLGLEVLRTQPPPLLEAHIRQYVGQAYVRSSRPDEGLDHIRRAQKILETEPDPWLAVECADWEASALYLREDGRALGVAERALRLCRATSPRLPGTEARILEHIAAIHVKNHNYDQAISFYENALEAAGAVRDLVRLGRTYHGLSIAYQERGDLARAIEYTHKALALYTLEHDNALLARGENELGLLLMNQGQLQRAESALRSALARFEGSETPVAKSHVLLSLAELHLKAGRYDEGIATARDAIKLAKGLGERMAESSGHQLAGRLYELTRNRNAADREFATAIGLLKSPTLKTRLTEAHALYAEILEKRGESRRAAAHWKQAALSALPAVEPGRRTARR